MNKFTEQSNKLADEINECDRVKAKALIALDALKTEAVQSIQANVTPGGMVFTREDGLSVFLPDREDGQAHVLPATDGNFVADVLWTTGGTVACHFAGTLYSLKLWLAMH